MRASTIADTPAASIAIQSGPTGTGGPGRRSTKVASATPAIHATAAPARHVRLRGGRLTSAGTRIIAAALQMIAASSSTSAQVSPSRAALIGCREKCRRSRSVCDITLCTIRS